MAVQLVVLLASVVVVTDEVVEDASDVDVCEPFPALDPADTDVRNRASMTNADTTARRLWTMCLVPLSVRGRDDMLGLFQPGRSDYGTIINIDLTLGLLSYVDCAKSFDGRFDH